MTPPRKSGAFIIIAKKTFNAYGIDKSILLFIELVSSSVFVAPSLVRDVFITTFLNESFPCGRFPAQPAHAPTAPGGGWAR